MNNKKLQTSRFYDLDEVEKNNPITISGNGQNSTKSRLKMFVVIFGFLIILSTTLALYFTPKNPNNSSRNNNDELSTPNITDSYRTGASSMPSVINVPPGHAYVGEEYYYVPRIHDADTAVEDIEFTFISGPDWLSVEGAIIAGTPTIPSERVELIKYALDDGDNYVEFEYYIFVYPDRSSQNSEL